MLFSCFTIVSARLRAWLYLEEDEPDTAEQILARHVDSSNDEYRLLSYHFLFKTKRPQDACSQALEWVRDSPPGRLSFEGAMDTIALLVEQQQGATALKLCQALLDRLRSAFSLLAGTITKELRDAYSEAAVRCKKSH